MDFVDALRVLGRRWLIVLLGVLVTGGAGVYAITVVPTEYQARAQYIVLLPSGASGTNNPTNPYINLNSGLIFATSLITSNLGTKDVARNLVKAGFESDYSIAQSTSGGPSLDVIVEGTDADDVLETRNELLARFDEELDSLQDIPGIPDRQLLFSRTNAVDPVAEVVPGAKKKALILIAAVGMIVTLIMAFSIDGMLRRRRASKLAQRESEAVAPSTPEDPPTTVEERRPEPSRTEPTRAETAKAEAARFQPGRAEADEPAAEAELPDPEVADPDDAEPGQAEQDRAEQDRAEQDEAEPDAAPEAEAPEPQQHKNGSSTTQPTPPALVLSGRKFRRGKSVSRTS